MADDKLFQYYAEERFLPTFGNFENFAQLTQYTERDEPCSPKS